MSLSSRLKSPQFLACAAILFGSGIALPAAVHGLGLFLIKKPIEVELKLNSIPGESDHFKQVTEDRPFDASVQETLGTHNYISRVYARTKAEEGEKVGGAEVHLAYYTGQIDTVPHVPERCMVGAGWSLAGSPRIVPVKLDMESWTEDEQATAEVRAIGHSGATIHLVRMGPTSRAPGNRVRMPMGVEGLSMLVNEFTRPGSDKKMYAGYFFVANGGWSASAEGVRTLAFDLRSDYAYYLKVQFSSEQATSAEELAALSAEWLNEYLPDVMLCVPDWVEVIRGNYPADNPRRKRAGVEGIKASIRIELPTADSRRAEHGLDACATPAFEMEGSPWLLA